MNHRFVPTALLLMVALLGAPVAPAAAGPQRSALHTIPFSSGAIDPVVDLVARVPVDHDLVLVQFRRFGDPRMVRSIRSTGVTLIQPLAPVSYIVWANAMQTRALRALPGARWAGVLPTDVRVSDTVTASTTRLRVTTVITPQGGSTLPSDALRRFTGTMGSVFWLEGGLADAVELTANPWVYSVGAADSKPELRDELSAQVVTNGTPKSGIEPGYRALLEEIKADGSGVILSHVDGGVDFHHPDLAGRLEACIDYTPVPQCATNNSDDAIGHGTHTLGIVLGTGETGLTDSNGFVYGQGMAPGATAVVQNMINLAGEFPETFTPVYEEASKLGAIVSANSWGPAGTPQGYDEDTREFDTMVRDVNASKPGDQPMGLVFSVMNGSGGISTQGSPDEGKNLIGVGGTGNRPNGPGHDDLCTCTAHGPALDGRLLPTLVAPGQNVVSTRALQGTLCGVPYAGAGTAIETPSPLHSACTGTSMASPHVSGAYAVFVDWYRDRFGRTPSPALVKAAFVNGAEDLAGGMDANGVAMSHIPNNQQGWGRLNLSNVFDRWNQREVVHVDQKEVFTRSGQAFVLKVKAVDESMPLKVTLTWTDAPGSGLGKKTPGWVNDLDLVVRSGVSTWFGNAFSDGWSTKGGKPDRMNNLENVYLRRAGDGTYEIVIDAANIIGNGLPNRPGAADQDFALVITNARKV